VIDGEASQVGTTAREGLAANFNIVMRGNYSSENSFSAAVLVRRGKIVPNELTGY